MEHTSGLCQILTYDQQAYPFINVTRAMFDVADLALLHEHHPKPARATGDQDTPMHALFYREFGQVQHIYERFVKEVVAPPYDQDLCVQRVPTFRVQYPGATAVREYHRDSDYHHDSGIINYWMALTPAFATNTIWVETEPGSEQFGPVDLAPGQVLRFSAVMLKHGNERNVTPVTRVSFDFRVLPFERYRDSGMSTVTSGRRLRLGDYYMLLTREGEFSHRGEAG